MFYIFGQMKYGKVDRVPGAFYVVTQFFHVNFVPLIPTSTYVVVEGTQSGRSFRGKQIPMSFKSVLTAWSRFALGVGVLITAAVGFFALLGGVSRGEPDAVLTGVVMAGVSVACAVVFWLTYRMSHASENRALQLADELGMSRAFVLRCLDPNRSAMDVPELEHADADERDYDRRDYDRRDRDYDRRDYDRRDRDYDRRDRERDREAPDPDYDRRDY